jgi:hypothetical protein
MHRKHGKLFLNRENEDLIRILEEIRIGGVSRKSAYRRLACLRSQDKLKGAGPAYFTKFIHFFMPEYYESLNRGFIMDQWLAKSVNIIYGKSVVRLNNDLVSDENTDQDYENFCCCVEAIAQELDVPPVRAEEMLFCKGGRAPGAWRAYVRDKCQSRA